MLRQVAEGVLIHESEFCQSNAVVVQGRAGVLLIDPGVLGYEMAALANDLSDSGQPVVAGFSTHPHWDHLLWHADLGAAPRYGTARCAATVRDRLSDPRVKKTRIVAELKDKMPSLAPAIRPGGGVAPIAILPEGASARDAVSALTNLGYGHAQAAAAVSLAVGKAGREARTEELIRRDVTVFEQQLAGGERHAAIDAGPLAVEWVPAVVDGNVFRSLSRM